MLRSLRGGWSLLFVLKLTNLNTTSAGHARFWLLFLQVKELRSAVDWRTTTELPVEPTEPDRCLPSSGTAILSQERSGPASAALRKLDPCPPLAGSEVPYLINYLFLTCKGAINPNKSLHPKPYSHMKYHFILVSPGLTSKRAKKLVPGRDFKTYGFRF